MILVMQQRKRTGESSFLELVDVLYLVCNLKQEAGLETVLSAAFFLKHAAILRKSFSTQKEALDKAHELAPGPVAAMKCVRNTPSGRFTLCVKGKLIKPPDFKQPNADSLVQIAQMRRGVPKVHVLLPKISKDS